MARQDLYSITSRFCNWYALSHGILYCTCIIIIIIIIIIMKMNIVQKYTEKNEKWKINTHMKWMS